MSDKELITKADLKLVAKEASQAEGVLNIKTDDDAEQAAEMLIHLKIQVDTAEEKRKEYVQPSQEAISRINADFKKITEPRLDIMSKLKENILSYVRVRKVEIKKEEKALQKKMGDRSLVLDNGLDKLVASNGEIRFRREVNIKVVNKKLVPDKYWIIDTKAIEKDMKDGEEIPGVKIVVEPIGTLAVYKDKE